MKRKKSVLFFLFLFSARFAFAQSNDSLSIPQGPKMEQHYSILVAYNQWHFGFAEIGFAKNMFSWMSHHPIATAHFVSFEIKVDDKLMIGPKIGAWVGGGVAGMALGINMIYYTDLNEGTLRLRPEIGIGFDRFKMVYGYNIPLANSDFKGINKHNVTFAYLIGVRQIK